MSGTGSEALAIRRANAGDRAAIGELLAASLGRDADPRYGALFAWKHDENPFGSSPAWVACDASRVVGFRVLMRWEFEPVDRPDPVRAVRAVDTATHPDYQGRGIFRRLTLHAIEELRAEGVAFVFNTPNAQSRPGYLKMGWQVVGRLPTVMRPIRFTGVHRILTARVPAERWSIPSEAGEPAADVLADVTAVGRLLASLAPPEGLRTRRSPEFLRWRFATPLLGCRAMVHPDGVEGGLVLFRLRRRGSAREVALGDVIVPNGDRRRAAHLVRRVARAAEADYLIGLDRSRLAPGGAVRLPRQGPLLTWRAVTEATMPAEWDLTLGDIELF